MKYQSYNSYKGIIQECNAVGEIIFEDNNAEIIPALDYLYLLNLEKGWMSTQSQRDEKLGEDQDHKSITILIYPLELISSYTLEEIYAKVVDAGYFPPEIFPQ